MRSEVVEVPAGRFAGFFRIKSWPELRCYYDSIEDFLAADSYDLAKGFLAGDKAADKRKAAKRAKKALELGKHYLSSLKVERITPERTPFWSNAVHTSYGMRYHFVLRDDTGVITVTSLFEPGTDTYYPFREVKHSDDEWTKIVNVREGDIVDVVCLRGDSKYWLRELKNRSLENRTLEYRITA